MKLEFGICPRCKEEISKERLNESVIVCGSCGFTENKGDQTVDHLVFKTFTKQALIFSVVTVGLFIQTVNYDKYAVEVIPLQLSQMIGKASEADFVRLAQIYEDRKNWDSLEETLTNQFKLIPQNPEPLFKLGELQFKRKHYQKAIQTLSFYINSGGLNLMGAYYKAQALGETGQVDEASTYFEQVLKAKPETLQITVAQKYVQLLLKHNRQDRAREVIEEIRKLGANSNLFMEQEFKALAKK